jgi:flagellar assembly protein FliH
LSKRTIFTGDDATGFAAFAEQLPKSSDLQAGGKRKATGDGAKDLAFREAYAAGYAGGFEQGRREAMEQEGRLAQQFREEMVAVVHRVEMAMELWYQKSEVGVARLARDVAERIIADELQLRPDAIMGIVREALNRVANSTHARVRVNPFDLPALAERKEQLMQACNSVHEIEIVGDEQLSPGSTIIESDSGLVDATVESKLRMLLPEDAA